MGEKSEKQQALLPTETPLLKRAKRKPILTVPRTIALLVILGTWLLAVPPTSMLTTGLGFIVDSEKTGSICDQASELTPKKNGEAWEAMKKIFAGPSFKARAIDWLTNAVRVKTESYDGMAPPGMDERWEAMPLFHDYLLAAFPLAHKALKLTKVNTYGLLYHWQGSDSELKPILLAAHFDVVPVHPDTVDQWVHPPYSGYFDGQRIWGRGSSDDKGGLIGIMASVETLLAQQWEPTRSVVLAFGFDEETSGIYGASSLGKHMLSAYGKDAFAMIVDEGAGFMEKLGATIATPGIAEKGYIDVRVEVTAPGGHSSIPPPHTSIGMLSAVLVHLEANPFKVKLKLDTPIFETIQCLAEHAPKLPSKVKKAVQKASHSDRALKKAQDYFFQDSTFKSLVGTTQAIDLIGGGVKSNALPEKAWAVINHRIATESSVGELKARDTKLLKSLANTFNLSYNAFGVLESDSSSPAYGTLTLEDAFHDGLEPAPITATDGAPYKFLSGTIKSTYNAFRSNKSDAIVVAPGIMSGNTDTRHYWDLSQHIFRYNHLNLGSGAALAGGVHTVNEYMVVDSFLEMILFFTTLILNGDESTTF